MGTVNESEDDGRTTRIELLTALMVAGFDGLEAIDVVYGHVAMPGQNNRSVGWLPDCQAREVVQAQDRALYRQRQNASW